MHIRLPRNKKRVWLLTLIYRFLRPLLAFFTVKSRLALYLDLEWIFARLSHEESFRFYSKANHPLLGGTVKHLTEHLKPGTPVLDLGCGHGDISFLLAQAGHEVVGIDHDEQHIASAKKNYHLPNLSFECQDAIAFLTNNKKRFHTLLLSHTLEHLDNPSDFLKSFAEFFENIYIEVPDFDCAYLNTFRVDAGAKLLFTDSDHVTEFDRDELLRTVSLAGLKVQHQEFRFGVLRVWCSKN